LVIVIPVQQ